MEEYLNFIGDQKNFTSTAELDRLMSVWANRFVFVLLFAELISCVCDLSVLLYYLHIHHGAGGRRSACTE
jgi:hypothetical protein